MVVMKFFDRLKILKNLNFDVKIIYSFLKYFDKLLISNLRYLFFYNDY